MLNGDFFPKGRKNSFNSFLQLRISSYYWNSEEFIFQYMPWLVYWASTPNVRACPYYCFLCSQCDDGESNQITWADPEDFLPFPCSVALSVWVR